MAYNESNQLSQAVLCDGRTTRKVCYSYDEDGNLEKEYSPTDNSLTSYQYTVEARLEAVYTGNAYNRNLQMAAAYDGDGNRVYQVNYNPEKDEDFSCYYASYDNCDYNGTGIRLKAEGETSPTEEELIRLIAPAGAVLDSRYELIEYVNDVNREYVEVLVEQNINGRTDTTYTYGVDRISRELFNQTAKTSYYLYDPRGSVAGLVDTRGHLTKTYQYTVTGELTHGSAAYENEYTYNGESYNPNIHSQYLRARYYSVVTASFLTEDSYLGNIREPLTLNRYNYCISSYLNYEDPSGNRLIPQDARDEIQKLVGRDYYIHRIPVTGSPLEMLPPVRKGYTIPPMWTPTYGVEREANGAWMDGGIGAFLNDIKCEHDAEYYLQIAAERAEENRRNEVCEPTDMVYALVGTARNPLTEDEKKSNARHIYNYLSQEGWTVEAISGLFGNIERESGFNPGVWYTLNNANLAYGLVQWRPAKGKFFSWMEIEKGYDMLSDDKEVKYSGVNVVNGLATENPQLLMDLQLEYLIWSSQPTTHSDYREWIATTRYGSPYKMGYAEYIVSEHDVGELALVFHASYERSEDNEAIKQERAQNAKKWYNYLISIQN